MILILADDLGWKDHSIDSQNGYFETPALKRLAARGTVFTRAYSASPLCSPTRASLMTGLSPARTGITAPVCHLAEERLKPDLPAKAAPTRPVLECRSATRLDTRWPTLAEAFTQSGYATAHFGKWHLGRTPYSALEHGFQTDVPHWPGPGPAGSHVAPWKFGSFTERSPHEHIEDRMADEAIAWIEQHRDKPFFLNYWMFSVHAPFDAKPDLVAKYRRKVEEGHPGRCAVYGAMVETMDANVGKLLDALDRLGLANRTVVIFLSDNGGNMYDRVEGLPPTTNKPLRGGKATVHEGGLRVPCIVHWPGITRPGGRSAVPIQSTDFFPTLAASLSLRVPDNIRFDGIDITPALKGANLPKRPLFTYFPHGPKVPDALPPSATVMLDDWKLIRLFHEHGPDRHGYRLFHLKDDAGEQRNLAADQPAIVARMDALITEFLRDSGAVTPMPNPAFVTSLRDPAPPSRR